MVIPTAVGDWGGGDRPSPRDPHQSLRAGEVLIVSILNFCCTNGSMAKKQQWLKTLALSYQQIS